MRAPSCCTDTSDSGVTTVSPRLASGPGRRRQSSAAFRVRLWLQHLCHGLASTQDLNHCNPSSCLRCESAAFRSMTSPVTTCPGRSRAPAFTDGLQRAAAMSPPKPMSLPPLAPPQPMEVPYEVKPHFSSLQMQLAQRPTRHAHWRPEKKKK